MTDVTIRSARDWTDARRTAIGAGRAFPDRRPEDGFFQARVEEAPALPLENSLLLTVDGELAGGLQVYERSVVLGGAPVTAAAIGNVFTVPEYRGEGYGARLLEGTRAFLAEKGYPFSMLLTGHRGFYEDVGWQPCPSPVSVVADAAPLKLDDGRGEWRAFDPDADLDAFLDVYRAGVDREGRFLRPRALLEGWTFASAKRVLDPGSVRLRVRDGDVVGYLVRRSDDEGVLRCLEAVPGESTDADAFAVACWNALASDADRVAWHGGLPEGLRAPVRSAGGSVHEETDDHCFVQVHDERVIEALLGVATTDGLVEHLAGSDWYWTDVDAF